MIETPRSILILKPSSFGDIIHTLPAVAWLKTAWPDCRISWLVNTEWTPLLENNPDVEEVIPFPRRAFRGVGGPLRFLRWCRETITGRKPTLALDFQGLLRSALIGRLSGAQSLYGMSDAREGSRWFYQRVAPLPMGVIHSVDRYLLFAETVLRWTGIGGSARETTAKCPLPEGEALNSDIGDCSVEFVLLHPFARGTGKSLSASQVEAFCRRLAPRRVILVGRRGEQQMETPETVVDLLGRTTLPQLIWLMRRAACFVSVDSGPAHLAAALNKPLIAIHTWSDPRRVGPYRGDAWVWKNGVLLPMAFMRSQPESFFQQTATSLAAPDIEAICARTILLSNSCA